MELRFSTAVAYWQLLGLCIAKTYSSYCHIDYCYCVRTIGHAVKNAYPKATQIEYQPYRKSFWPQTVFRFVPIIHCALYEYECTAYCFPWYYVLLGPPRPLLYTCNGSRPGGPQRPQQTKHCCCHYPCRRRRLSSVPAAGAQRRPKTMPGLPTPARAPFFLDRKPCRSTKILSDSQHKRAPDPNTHLHPHIFIIYSHIFTTY